MRRAHFFTVTFTDPITKQDVYSCAIERSTRVPTRAASLESAYFMARANGVACHLLTHRIAG